MSRVKFRYNSTLEQLLDKGRFILTAKKPTGEEAKEKAIVAGYIQSAPTI
jgi:preprotein translocase subunit Sss1